VCSCIADIACGTGDLGDQLATRTGGSVAVGLDLSPQMLTEAKSRLRKKGSKLMLVACDMLSLCLLQQIEAAPSLAGFKVEWCESRFGGGVGLHIARRVTLPSGLGTNAPA